MCKTSHWYNRIFSSLHTTGGEYLSKKTPLYIFRKNPWTPLRKLSVRDATFEHVLEGLLSFESFLEYSSKIKLEHLTSDEHWDIVSRNTHVSLDILTAMIIKFPRNSERNHRNVFLNVNFTMTELLKFYSIDEMKTFRRDEWEHLFSNSNMTMKDVENVISMVGRETFTRFEEFTYDVILYHNPNVKMEDVWKYHEKQSPTGEIFRINRLVIEDIASKKGIFVKSLERLLITKSERFNRTQGNRISVKYFICRNPNLTMRDVKRYIERYGTECIEIQLF